MSPTLRTEIAGMIDRFGTEAPIRVAETLFLTVTSPEYAYQR